MPFEVVIQGHQFGINTKSVGDFLLAINIILHPTY